MFTNLRFLNRDLSDSPQPRRPYFSPLQERKARSMSPAKSAKPANPFLPPITAHSPQKPQLVHSFHSKPTNSLLAKQSKGQFLDVRNGEESSSTAYVFGFGLGAGFYKPVGVAFLVASSVVVTSRSVVHSQETAGRCQLQFVDSSEVYNFSPYRLFVTHPHLSLSIIAIEPADDAGKRRPPIDIMQRFSLDEEDLVLHMNSSYAQSRVKMVDPQRFYFRSGAQLLAGTPVYDENWRLQGVTVTSSSTYHYNEAIRVDALSATILASSSWFQGNSEMDELASKLYYRPAQPAASGEIEELCWFEWLQQRVIRYRVDTDRWTTMDIANGDELDIESHGDWYFLWGCKVAVLPDASYLLVGGSINQAPSDEVYHYSVTSNRITRRQRLNVGRLACALATLNSVVYALGGEYTNGSCERYSQNSMKWTFISPMSGPRHSMNGIAMGNLVYVVGGMPLSSVGSTIERYLPQRDVWEMVPVSLPEAVCNSGLCLVSPETIAIMGGRLSKRVFTLQVLGSSSSFLVAGSNSLQLHECMSFSLNTETAYPTFVSVRTGVAYLFNSHEGEHRPVLVKYKQECFFRRPPKTRSQVYDSRRADQHANSFLY